MAKRRPKSSTPQRGAQRVPPVPVDLLEALISAETYTTACRRYGIPPQARYRSPRADADPVELTRRRRRAVELDWSRLHGVDPPA